MDDTRIDFVESLESDMAFSVMMRMDDPADLVRASSVSRFWRHFVISNGLSKELCVKIFPQLKNIASITLSDVGSSKSRAWNNEEKDHNVYSSLLQLLNKSTLKTYNCVTEAICASSTDHDHYESIINTLDPRDRYYNRASYWSSTGQTNPNVPESLVYKLDDNLCLVTDIQIQPFAYFKNGGPIYSPKAVRFKMGHPRSVSEMETNLQSLPWKEPNDDKFVWTYTSQEFPMIQINRLQKFKLPEPVLCVGGFVKVELLGRVQRDEIDDLFYICVSHVKIFGHPLSPAFEIESVEQSGKFSLKYDCEAITSK